MIDLNKVAEYGSQIVAGASILHASLPPVSAFQPYPRLQKAYQFFVFIVGLAAVNWRGEQQNVPSQPSKIPSFAQVVPVGGDTIPNTTLGSSTSGAGPAGGGHQYPETSNLNLNLKGE